MINYISYTFHTFHTYYTNYIWEECHINKPKGKHAWTAKVGEKGQIVIPKEAREIFNIKPGDTLLLLGDEDQGIAIVKNELFKQLAKVVFNEKEDMDEEKGDKK